MEIQILALCAHSFNCCIHLYMLILYRCSDTKTGQAVVMVTSSIALAAKCSNVCMCKCTSGIIPMGASSVWTVQAVSGCEHRDMVLGGARPCRPLSSERRGRATGAEQKRKKKKEKKIVIQGRTNKLTLCLSISLSHLRPFHSGMCPICLLRVRTQKTRKRDNTEREERNVLRRKGPEEKEKRRAS